MRLYQAGQLAAAHSTTSTTPGKATLQIVVPKGCPALVARTGGRPCLGLSRHSERWGELNRDGATAQPPGAS